MLVYPRLGERTAITLQVLHPLPGRMSRTGQKTACLLVAELVFQQSVVPHGLQTDYGKRHVDGIHGHIVDFALPAFPIPPGGGIADRTIVHIHTVFPLNRILDRRGHGQPFRQIQLVAQPGHMRMACIFQIMVERRSYRDGIVSLQDDFPVAGHDFVGVFPVHLADEFQLKLRLISRSDTGYQVISGP